MIKINAISHCSTDLWLMRIVEMSYLMGGEGGRSVGPACSPYLSNFQKLIKWISSKLVYKDGPKDLKFGY